MRSLRRPLLCCALIAGATVLTPHTGQAAVKWNVTDKSVHTTRPTKLDVVGTIDFFGVFHTGIGAWYSVPVVPDGFIPGLNDSFVVEVGGLLEYWRYSSGFTSGLGGSIDCSQTWYRLSPMGGVRWDFFLTDDWTVFGKGKAGWSIGFADSGLECSGVGVTTNSKDIHTLAVDLGVGAYWHFAENMALRLETGVNSIIAVGISMEM